MFAFHVRLRLGVVQGEAVLRSLIRILGPTRARAGCARCTLAIDVEDRAVLSYLEEWADRDQLEARLRDDSMRVLLAAMDCATEAPEIRFDTICETKGMELIAACREGAARQG